MSDWRWSDNLEAERWHEEEAVRLLQEVGSVVGWFEAEGARIPAQRREKGHARIVEAYKTRDMVAWWRTEKP